MPLLEVCRYKVFSCKSNTRLASPESIVQFKTGKLTMPIRTEVIYLEPNSIVWSRSAVTQNRQQWVWA